jgi:hypothetical protein
MTNWAAWSFSAFPTGESVFKIENLTEASAFPSMGQLPSFVNALTLGCLYDAKAAL